MVSSSIERSLSMAAAGTPSALFGTAKSFHKDARVCQVPKSSPEATARHGTFRHGEKFFHKDGCEG